MALIWELHEQYLREAEFLFEMWETSLDSPSFVLEGVLQGPEHRLVTQIDALVIGGEDVVERLLLPALEDPKSEELRVRVASLTILVSASPSACERVLAALEWGSQSAWRGVVRALVLAQRDGLTNWLGRSLDDARGADLAGRLEALAGLRVDVGARLRGWLASDELPVLLAAAKLAKHCSDGDAVRSLLSHTQASEPELRRAAVESALTRWLPGIWESVCTLAHECDDIQLREVCRLWVAMLGNTDAHDWLLGHAEAKPGIVALRNAGATGRAQAVDLAMQFLDDPSLARVAGEVVSAIAGLPMADERYWLDSGAAESFGMEADEALPPLLDDDLDASLVPVPEDYLPLPNPQAVREWWFEQRSDFSADVRYIAGGAHGAERIIGCLLELPTRRRHVLAQELMLRSAGGVWLDTRTWARQQLQQIDALAQSLRRLEYQRGMRMS